ncbi:lysine transporter LysE [Acinetobacter sp. SFB]|uniref:LysE family transporter n=1 Tax=Acinetobacter sp. SFB TaxID=1805634 RepID=UPI0007D7A4E0|nr:LysE family transporter [Acinetobacter sp. SFB]OAL76801.1 lysine transporter LysE [Acinetobacter sp. SFB]
MLIGLITGDLIFLLTSIFLLASLTQFIPNFSLYLVLLSSMYLLYLAYSFWSFNGDLLQTQAKNTVNETIFSYRDGLFITLSNPKTISFYLAIVSAIFGVFSLKEQTFSLIIITVLTLAIIGGLYVFFSLGLKKCLRNLKIQRALLKGLSLMMFILALSMIYREFMPYLT